MKYLKQPLRMACAILLFSARGFSQESSSKPSESPANAPNAVTTPGGPSAALKDVLAAACSENQIEFARFLTARNKDAFSRMTPSARVALMKRFVLLNEPGKATASINPSGRPLVRCETTSVTTEMQIGGVELRENLAFLPMELRDATDSTGAEVRQISVGLVREQGDWKLLSLGVLFLDLPALETEWDEAEIETTEKNAFQAVKDIATAVEAYRAKYPRLPESLANLGQPLHGAPSAEAAGLLDSDLANGMKNGYAFRYVIVGASNLGAPAKYELSATPLRYARTGRRSFFRDSNGGLHAADRQGGIGSASDPRAE
ncbi:MAG TPA: hypothetical protein VH114_06820 [Candidatus Acidoferrum sp.]|jgi:hypothetical protein|nr:hypothetical protein [Candidatus Acidoferrum sp.]